MSAALRKLAFEPNGELAGRAYIDAMNFCRTGLIAEQKIAERLIASSTLSSSDAIEAISRGFAAARRPA
jgi:hypothetical protein